MEKNEGLLHKISEGFRDMCYIWWLEMKNTIKDEGVLIFFILVPLGYPLLYSWIYNSEVVRDLPVAIVDMSHSKTSRQFIRHFDASPSTKAAFFCNDLQEAKDLMGKQVVHGVLYFPENFERNLYRGEQVHVGVYCDMSLMLGYKNIYQTAQAVSTALNERIQVANSGGMTNRDDEINVKPLDFEEVQIFNTTGGYGNFLLPAVLMLILQQTLLLGIGLSAGTARENNRYEDLVPISKHYNGIFRIVLGKGMCYFMIFSIMGAYITMIVPKLFQFTAIASRTDLIMLLIPYILSVTFFGMTMSCLVRYRENVLLLVVFTSVPFLFLSGISWPRSSMPAFWKVFSWLFPSTFGIQGYVKLNSMGGSLYSIQTEYQALWLQVLAYFSSTCLVYNYQIVSARKHVLERLERIKAKLTE